MDHLDEERGLLHDRTIGGRHKVPKVGEIIDRRGDADDDAVAPRAVVLPVQRHAGARAGRGRELGRKREACAQVVPGAGALEVKLTRRAPGAANFAQEEGQVVQHPQPIDGCAPKREAQGVEFLCMINLDTA